MEVVRLRQPQDDEASRTVGEGRDSLEDGPGQASGRRLHFDGRRVRAETAEFLDHRLEISLIGLGRRLHSCSFAIAAAEVQLKLKMWKSARYAVEGERQLEDALSGYLGAHGWIHEPGSAGYDKKRALWPDDLFSWLGATQPDTLAAVVRSDKDA